MTSASTQTSRRQDQPIGVLGAAPFVPLNRTHLEKNRIISFDGADERSLHFRVMRNQIVRDMDEESWQVLAVTSPTSECGVTVTAANLALSAAGQSDRNVLLVGLNADDSGPATCLGVHTSASLNDYLEGRACLGDVSVRADIAGRNLVVIPSLIQADGPLDPTKAAQITNLIGLLRLEPGNPLIILDMPPLLSSSDVMSLIPAIDCALLVLAVGRSTASELERCKECLEATNILRIVLNKDREATGSP
ncbi:protein tyrosine kinase [Microvirga sp. BT688]|uniref:protein tyrosine kinase n=1 Tax=Microvirga sp. TaxID=1873136 RepID=UPI0016875151|nr:protein tyrosine kinase [Microvirga sp.]MBD2750175.1 protein tyrosine kinase [Microvirga sp.]